MTFTGDHSFGLIITQYVRSFQKCELTQMFIQDTQIEGGTGHPGFICHKQPVLERSIRGVIEKQKSCEIRLGSTVTSISEDNDYTYVFYADKDGQSRTIRSKFFVGADGKTGFTRKRYLEPKGISMEKDDK